MRFFDTDWNLILSWLDVWEKLSPAARRHYLTGKSHAESVSSGGYGADLELALSMGLVEQVSTGRIRPTKAGTPFRAIMVQLAKWPLFEGNPDRKQLEEYLHKHYISDEQRTLYAWKASGWDSPERVSQFLEAKNISAWEKPLLTYHEFNGSQASGYSWFKVEKTTSKKTWFPNSEITEAARWVVRRALESKQVWRLRDLAREVPEPMRPHLDTALKACLRHALLFAALDPNSLELLVGVCPFTLHLANRPEPVPPVVEQCSDVRGVAFHVEDMTQLLALAATDECFLNQGSYQRHFFKNVETRLTEDFVQLPEWLGDRAPFSVRLHAAAESLQNLRFVADTGRKEAKRKLKATVAGKKWLAQPPADRLKQVLFEFQRFWKHDDWEEGRSDQDGYSGYDDPFDDSDIDDFDFVEDDDAFAAKAGSGKKVDLFKWQKTVWRQAPTDGCMALDVFLDYHARLSLPRAESTGAETATRNNLADEELCRARLENFFWRVLVPFGCVEGAQRAQGKLWFRLSPAGQYFVGLKRVIQHGPTANEKPVVVQPNFDIVFLAPDINAEVAIAPFAERCGRSIGTLFRLTRQKMLLAASRGVKLETVLALLAEHSSTPVPGNVVAEVKAWFGACRSLAVRHSTLIQTGDPETALRVKQVLGSECTVLSSTLLEWPAQDIPPKLAAKLREQGLFPDMGLDGVQ